MKLLIAHAPGEEEIAERIAVPLRAAGYDVAHQGTVLVGDSVIEEASALLGAGAHVVLCGTVRCVGTGLASRIVNAARMNPATRIYPLQVDRDAYLAPLALDARPAEYWRDPARAMAELIKALAVHLPSASGASVDVTAAEAKYRRLLQESCDIIGLANLPEMDRHIATRQLELRRLYVALRVLIDPPDDQIEALERRPAQRSEFDDGEGEENLVLVASVGERLSERRRLVVLGDPGAGKTTMLRWLATAYLLRLRDDPHWSQLPDVATLPDEDWLPIMIRCRDLPQAALEGSFDDVLTWMLRRAELAPGEVEAMREALRRRLVEGSALVLIDGLDEIADAGARARFTQHLESILGAYPEAAIVATSRIVGYREMGYRLGHRFEHVTVADLSPEDKDLFARRWCAVSEVKERREIAAEELIADIHSADRIERLTGNPMLLTTMALIKRKVGKLPSRRADLYWSAVEVLLNWRREVDAPLDQHEAIPQLEYIAYAMCERGEQRLREDEILELLRQMRADYPQVAPVHERSPEAFLQLLERRTGILLEAGRVRHLGREVPVFEFRHLTFQEYLAGLALVDGRHPNRDRSRSLAERVGDLVGEQDGEFGFAENWREAVRLCVTSCRDDDVDPVLRAIVRPDRGEQSLEAARSRAALAGLCIADEPNVSDEVADEVMQALIDVVNGRDGNGPVISIIDQAGAELGRSRWADRLSSGLIERFLADTQEENVRCGGLCADISAMRRPESWPDLAPWLSERLAGLAESDVRRATKAALELMHFAYEFDRQDRDPDLDQRTAAAIVERLFDLAAAVGQARMAALWALFWFVPTLSTLGIAGAVTPAQAELLRAWRHRDDLSETERQFVADILQSA
ncbi:NACHT domain-containing protein [Solirubrobacter ginsenosidimutans]|uniref:NACHT domain-containing protein n=1 Tax=Solirubrobacter ginsenosidimutans TaxID=490573 RepID=A0A9X3SAP3_9ACTN|nr:NACHT domain-containing protein [Solirubrobacter ginsenosidimutans]MDA0166213.1 NACHT domain-containing protein [Solirubrobacter ginsenosidimutans]